MNPSHRVTSPSQTQATLTSTLSSLFENATGQPSEEKVLAVHSELVAALGRKRDIERSLLELEVQLYNYESSFLEKYSQGINLLKGFSAPTFFAPAADSSNVSLSQIDDSLRIFSNSSATSHKAISLLKRNSEKEARMHTDLSFSQKLSTPKTSGASTNHSRKGSNLTSKKSTFCKVNDEDDPGGLFHPRRKRSSSGLLVLSEDSEYECGRDGTYEDEYVSSICSSTDEEGAYLHDGGRHQHKNKNEAMEDEDYIIDDDIIPIRNKGRSRKKKP